MFQVRWRSLLWWPRDVWRTAGATVEVAAFRACSEWCRERRPSAVYSTVLGPSATPEAASSFDNRRHQSGRRLHQTRVDTHPPGDEQEDNTSEKGACTEAGTWSEEELKEHCAEIYDDSEEDNGIQETRIWMLRAEGSRQKEEGREVNITVDLVLRARGSMQLDKATAQRTLA